MSFSKAFRILQSKMPEESIFWMNATDPVSLCGMKIDALKSILPKRLISTHLTFQGNQLALISERNGKSLTFNVQPDDPNLQEILCSLRNLLNRKFQPIKQITIETINNENAARSPYVNALKTSFEVLVEFKKVTLYRKI